MEFNLADLFEAAVDAYPEREYLVRTASGGPTPRWRPGRTSWPTISPRQGIGPGDHVGIYAYNSVEWVETAWAVFKLRAIWININYRYVKDELRYLLTNADLQGARVPARVLPLVAALVARAAGPAARWW